MPQLAIMGTGMVGGALDRYLKTVGITAGLYDPPKGLSDPSVLAEAEIIFVAVPTPYYLTGVGFDDSYLHAAIKAIPVPGKTIVLKSTILPGTTERFQELYPQHRFLFNPEFLTEAKVDEDMQHPPRQIIGTTAQSIGDAEQVMSLLPRAPFERIVPARVAETIKYFGNAFLAMKVTFANQFYDLCQKIGVDYDMVKNCAVADPRIGPSHLDINHQGYRGYGGKCLPKDVRAILQLAEQSGLEMALLSVAETYNNELIKQQGMDIRWVEGSPI